jgi:hypothetical protein
VPDVFLALLKADGRDGLAGYVGEVGETAGSELVRVVLVRGLDVDSTGLMLMVEGGDFSDFDLEGNMLSVVMERVIERAWKG